MGVSGQHERLVDHIIKWVHANHGIHGDVCVYADHIDIDRNSKPGAVGGYVPDVLAKAVGRSLTIIGEAETEDGIERPHSKIQIGAFIDFLQHQANPILVIAVPWVAVPSARGLVRNLLRRRGNPAIETVFLDRLE